MLPHPQQCTHPNNTRHPMYIRPPPAREELESRAVLADLVLSNFERFVTKYKGNPRFKTRACHDELVKLVHEKRGSNGVLGSTISLWTQGRLSHTRGRRRRPAA